MHRQEYKISELNDSTIYSIGNTIGKNLYNTSYNIALYLDLDKDNNQVIAIEYFNSYIDIRSNLNYIELFKIFGYDDIKDFNSYDKAINHINDITFDLLGYL